MANYDAITDAIGYAWDAFATILGDELGSDFDKSGFFNIAESSISKVNDYVMQSTDFGVNCPSCGVRLDNEDDLQGIGCINCDTEYK